MQEPLVATDWRIVEVLQVETSTITLHDTVYLFVCCGYTQSYCFNRLYMYDIYIYIYVEILLSHVVGILKFVWNGNP